MQSTKMILTVAVATASLSQVVFGHQPHTSSQAQLHRRNSALPESSTPHLERRSGVLAALAPAAIKAWEWVAKNPDKAAKAGNALLSIGQTVRAALNAKKANKMITAGAAASVPALAVAQTPRMMPSPVGNKGSFKPQYPPL